jgi:hypothetical protein
MIKIDDVLFLLNSKMNSQDIGKIRIKTPSYHPDTKLPLNRTAFHLPTGTVVQINIWFNLCDVVISDNFDNFKRYLLKSIIKFMLGSIKNFAKSKIANEIGFKINFYFPYGSPPTQNSEYWNGVITDNETWDKNFEQVGVTTLDENILNSNRYTLYINLDDNYNLVKKPESINTRNNIWGNGINDGNNNTGNNIWGNGVNLTNSPNNNWNNPSNDNIWGNGVNKTNNMPNSPNNNWNNSSNTNGVNNTGNNMPNSPNNNWGIPSNTNGINNTGNNMPNSPNNNWGIPSNNTLPNVGETTGFQFGGNSNWDKSITQNDSNPWGNGFAK